MQRLQEINLLNKYCGRAKIESSLTYKQNIIVILTTYQSSRPEVPQNKVLTSFVYKHISVNILVKDAKLYLIETNKDSERERERNKKKLLMRQKLQAEKIFIKIKHLNILKQRQTYNENKIKK